MLKSVKSKQLSENVRKSLLLPRILLLLVCSSCNFYSEEEKENLISQTEIAIDSTTSIQYDLENLKYMQDEDDFIKGEIDILMATGLFEATMNLLDESNDRMEAALNNRDFKKMEEELETWRALTSMIEDKKEEIDSIRTVSDKS